MDQTFLEQVERITTVDERYRPDAYAFMMEALSFTQRRFNRDRHVTGEELLAGIKEFAVRKFGPFATMIFERWGVRSTEDFGHIVFNLIKHELLSKQDQDTFESFCNGYDLDDEFRKGYRQQLERAARRLR
jgi:uncharacterized repeat protein (TIGR04138 family)